MKAVIPAAGLGTRLLPITKSIPKELLPVDGKPAIQWVLEEAVAAGLREFVVVISPRKAILQEYLSPLDAAHPLAGEPALEALERLLRDIDITFVEQPHPRGLGDALLRCRDVLDGKSFVLILPDNLVSQGSRNLTKLLEIHREVGKSCLLIQRASGRALQNGAVNARHWREDLYEVDSVFSKNSQEKAFSDLRGVGRCVLELESLNYLSGLPMQGELEESPALDGLAREGRLLGMLIREEVLHLGS